MAIDPTTTTTVKVSELASAGYNTTDLIPHEVAGILKKGNLQDLATFIGGIISTEGAVGFRAVQVNDGETLPATDEQEFILVGPGTYPNVGGGPTITTTEPLNALVSNATYWFIGVEIPITATGVWGTITGVLSDQTDLNDLLDAKADLVDGKVPNSQLPSYVDDVVEVSDFAALPATGETGKIYVTIDTGNVYRWSGSAYIRIADESPVWGIITGTLSDQTDLQNALDGKFDVPTGDTTQYIAGDGSLITFPVAGQAGTLVRLVRNNSGATITKGTVVYINGASGNNPTIAKAIATGDSTSAQTFGLVQANITNNSNGYVVVTGDLIGVNTSAIAEGSQLYLSSTTAGEYTTTKQLAPAHLVYIGVVTRSHATLGQIEVKIQNGYELDELHDVAISSKANNEVIVYESSTDLWKNKSIATILGYTPANDASVVHLAGTETITGIKTFSVDTIINCVTVGKGGASEVGNTAVGENALSSNTSGILNTAIGFESLLNNTGGGDNTSLGWWSLKSNTTGNSNVSAGTASLANNTTGFGNTSLGWNSLAVSTTGAFNSALGYLAGSSFGGSDSNANTLTSYSIYIGYKAGPLANSQTNQIVIGKNAIGAGSNTVTIGNTDITTTRLRGEIQGGSFKKDGGTSSQFLKADGSVDSTTYQTALTNPVTGTGTTNYIPKFTGASAIGNSLIYDNGTNIEIGGGIITNKSGGTFWQSKNGATNYFIIGNDSTIAGGSVSDINYYTYSGNQIFSTAGSERMRITSGGNVGIGTTSPLTNLTVKGSGINTMSLQYSNDGGGVGYGIYNSSGTELFSIGGGRFVRQDELSISRQGTSVIYINNSNNVGIGTTSPTQKLTIGDGSGTGNQYLRINSSGSDIYIGQSVGTLLGISPNSGGLIINDNAYPLGVGTILAQPLIFGTANTERMRITSGGNVGIGTNSPTDFGSTFKVLTTSGSTGSFVLTSNSANTVVGQVGVDSSLIYYGSRTNHPVTFSVNTFEKMRLTTNGELLIGRTSSYGAGWQLAVEGNIYAKNDLRIDGEGSFGSSVTTTDLNVNRGGGAWQIIPSSGESAIYFKETSTGNVRMTIQGGNVGIGTTSPTGRLTIQRASSGAETDIDFLNEVGAGPKARIRFGGTNEELSFWTGGTSLLERMRITSGGNVGIGTTSPAYKLDVVGSIRVGDSSTSIFTATNALPLQLSRGLDVDVYGTNGCSLGIGSIKSGVYKDAVRISGGLQSDGVNGNFSIQTLRSNSYETALTITSGGNVQINTTSGTARLNIAQSGVEWVQLFNHTNAGTQYFSVFQYNGSTIGTITGNNTSTAYNTSSDYRLKQDLKPINGLDLVSQIKVYDYQWKADETRAYGVLAHELQEVIPQAVNGEKDGENMQGVDYSKLVPILVQAIQDQQKQINELKTLINK